jgi:hypothetical protein
MGKTIEFGAGVLDLLLDLPALRAIQFHHRARQPAVGAAGDGGDHLQIAHQFGYGGRRRTGFRLLGFAKQVRLGQQALPYHGGAPAPSGVKLSGFPRGEPMGGEDLGQSFAVGETSPRCRHQALHRHLRRDGARAYLLLYAFGEQLDQRQSPRYPSGTAIKAAREFFHPKTKLPLQFPQQPAFFQRRLPLAPAQRTLQHQGFGLGHRPRHRFHRVPA